MREPTILIACLAGLILIGWLVFYYRKRRQMLAGLALRLHMRYSSRDTMELLERLADLYLMQFGHSRRILNIIYGRHEERAVYAFDYRHETGSGQERIVHHYNVIVWQQKLDLPSIVALQNENFLPMGSFRNFTSLQSRDPKFDSLFQLYSDDPKTAEKWLTSNIRKILILSGDVNWEWNGNYIVFYTEKVLSALQITRLIHRGSLCCKLLEEQSLHS
jgi:hypothetical protein